MNLFLRRCTVITTHRNRYWSTKSDNSYSQHSLRGGNRFFPFFFMCTNNFLIFHIYLLKKACWLTSVWNGIFARFGEASGRKMTLLLRSCHCENALLGTPETSRRNFLGLGLCHFDIFFLFNWTDKWEESCKNQAFTNSDIFSEKVYTNIHADLIRHSVQLDIWTENFGSEGIKPSWITSKITMIHVIEILKIHVV